MVKVLELQEELKTKRSALDALEQKQSEFVKRGDAITQRIESLTDESPEEVRAAIDSDSEALDAEKAETETEVASVRAEIERLESELEELNANEPNNDANPEDLKKVTHTMEERFDYASPEYKRAFLKNIAVRDGRKLFGELDEVEQRAFTFTTANTGNVVPKDMIDRIVELIESQSPILSDCRHERMSRGFGVPRHTVLNSGDATAVAEGTANSDEQDTFDLLPLDGVEIKKHLKITRKMEFQSIDAFENWVVTHLAERIRVAKEAVVLARLNGQAVAGGSPVANAGIASSNILTGQTYSDATIRAMFAKLKGQGYGAKVIYANANTIWNHLVGLVGDDDVKLFVPDSMSNPLVVGRIYGALIKEDNNLADDVVYLGYQNAIIGNDFIDLEIMADRDATTFVNTVGGYALFDAALENPKAFVKASF